MFGGCCSGRNGGWGSGCSNGGVSGGCFVRRRDPHNCCRVRGGPSPDFCPPLPPQCPSSGYPAVILPHCCHKPTSQYCAQDFIIHAIKTPCLTPPKPCSEDCCGAKSTVINFKIPIRYTIRSSPPEKLALLN